MTEKERVTVDFFTLDQVHGEFVMYLVEDGPWSHEDLEQRMRTIQARIYNAVDVAIDGHLARAHPESRGNSIRIQVDLHGRPPEAIETLVARLAEHVAGSDEYRRDIEGSEHIQSLRIVAKQL